ncbi:MAG: metallophosphoesterase family protein [Rikenellaceae bacterium]
MKKIGIISDTHTTFDSKMRDFLKDCDEVWHAGDIGNIQTFDKLASFKPLRAVYGNIDGHTVRLTTKEILKFECEGVRVLMTHIGGYPTHYYTDFKNVIMINKPDLVITGHSHILKVMYDKKLNHLHINPGAAGNSGFHKVRTAIRLKLDKGNISDLEVCEWDRKSVM